MNRRSNMPSGSDGAPRGIQTVMEHSAHVPVRQRFFDRQAHMEEIEPLRWADVLPVRGTKQHWDRVR